VARPDDRLMGTPPTACSVSKVEMVAPMALIYKVLLPSISTFETPPHGFVKAIAEGVEGWAPHPFQRRAVHTWASHPPGLLSNNR
jgi:hypothetical protein